MELIHGPGFYNFPSDDRDADEILTEKVLEFRCFDCGEFECVCGEMEGIHTAVLDGLAEKAKEKFMNKKEGGYTLYALVFFIAVSTVVVTALTLWTDRNLDFWLTYFKKVPIDVPWYLSLLLTGTLNAVIVAANIIGEIARYFI